MLPTIFASGDVVGLEVTLNNPALDPDGGAGRASTEVLARGA